MGRRNRLRFFRGLPVLSKDIQQLVQDCKTLGIFWPELQRVGSDLPRGVQGLPLNIDEDQTLGALCPDGGAPWHSPADAPQTAASSVEPIQGR